MTTWWRHTFPFQLETEDHNLASVQTLRSAFTKAEKSHPGLTQQFLAGILDAEGVALNLSETLLRLAATECEEYIILCDIEEFQQLQQKAIGKSHDSHMCIA